MCLSLAIYFPFFLIYVWIIWLISMIEDITTQFKIDRRYHKPIWPLNISIRGSSRLFAAAGMDRKGRFKSHVHVTLTTGIENNSSRFHSRCFPNQEAPSQRLTLYVRRIKLVSYVALFHHGFLRSKVPPSSIVTLQYDSYTGNFSDFTGSNMHPCRESLSWYWTAYIKRYTLKCRPHTQA